MDDERIDIKKLTTDEFISKAKSTHGGRYDYSKTIYDTAIKKVVIICREHGEFVQTPNNHLNGQGCNVCGGTCRLDTNSFINKANEKHKGKYTYSKVKYINSYTKVVITCSVHGDFEQRPDDHCAGRGCYDCSGAKKYTVEKFIQKAKEVHGDKYDYSKVIYENSNTKVILICNEHGEFEQVPSSHINAKQGCPMCGIAKRANNSILSAEEFITKAKLIHGDKYDYSLADYSRHDTPVKIICTTHGVFEQKPVYHTTGSNCQECAKEMSKLQFNPLKETLLYYIVIGIGANTKYKVGITTKSVQERFVTEIRKGYTIKVISTRMFDTGKPAFMLEQLVLRAVKYKRHTGAKFLVEGVGDSELFNHPLTDEELKIFNDEGK